MTFPAKYPQLNQMEFTDAARQALVRVLRVAFPHGGFPSGPYERTTDKIIADANASTWFRMILLQGLRTLDCLSGGSFVDLGEQDAMKVLKHIEHTEFFGFVRRTTVLTLYDDHEVWDALGYEGPSFDKGGYLHRGFDDLDWLPEPRVTEYEGPDRIVEVAAELPVAASRER